jgi:hypothetical protein
VDSLAELQAARRQKHRQEWVIIYLADRWSGEVSRLANEVVNLHAEGIGDPEQD